MVKATWRDPSAGLRRVTRNAVRSVTQRNPSGPHVTSHGLASSDATTRVVKRSGPGLWRSRGFCASRRATVLAASSRLPAATRLVMVRCGADDGTTDGYGQAGSGTMRAMDVRLIAIDIDGTLLGSRGRIPEENISAIGEALAAGIAIVLVTGRSFPFARAVAGGLPSSVTLIVSNGAIERALDGRTIARRLLPRETAARVLARTTRFRHDSAILFDREA